HGAALADGGALDRIDAARVPVDRLWLDSRHCHPRPARDKITRLSGAARAGRRAAAELTIMRELVRTNDAGLISALEALLSGADIAHMVVDQNMSVLEGSIGIFPRRILVGEDQFDAARRLLEEAGLGDELRPHAD